MFVILTPSSNVLFRSIGTAKFSNPAPIDEKRIASVGPGREEVWTGTLKNHFPLHCEGELHYLQECWGTPKLLCRSRIFGFEPECQPKVLDHGDPHEQRAPTFEMNTFASSQNVIKDHALPSSLVYQPLEEIRDYFGDEVGLYFSWLGTYTRMLMLNGFFGIVVFICQLYFGGVDRNPLTLTYSVYTGKTLHIFVQKKQSHF